MRVFFYFTFIFLFNSVCNAQAFYDSKENYMLLKSGKKLVKMFTDSTLRSVFEIDSAKGIIKMYGVQLTLSSTAALYNDSMYITTEKLWYYNKVGTLDSVLKTHYVQDKVVSVLDIYIQPSNKKRILKCSSYRITRNERTKLESKLYHYNTEGNLIIVTGMDGEQLFRFRYNEEGKVERKYTCSKTAFIKYNYDEMDRRVKVTIVKPVAEVTMPHRDYEYNDESLLVKEISYFNQKVTTRNYFYE